MKEHTEWEFSIGLIKGLVIGFRKYEFQDSYSYDLYLLFINVSIEFYKR